ncbi:MAG TPA: Uma2 family endonuclease [Blastocatellia bacterium]|nr:Uma2 family endonuclease [Blastocatellia bacterium]
MTDDQFFALCQQNRDLRLERTAQGDIIVMPPTGFESGSHNSSITGQPYGWAKKDGTGVACDSSTGFTLPNGADRSPDVAWVRRKRLAQFTTEQKRKFLPLCPDFVVELRSPSDKLEDVQAKMREYIENGARLGWLIDPEARRVHVYRPGVAIEVLEGVLKVSGDPELRGFALDLREIWEPNV